jgi:hypothetical protein
MVLVFNKALTQGEEKVHPPATVKMLMIAPFVVGAIAFIGSELPQSAVLGQQNQSTSIESKADGLYLYGETPQPKQLTKGYVVFQRQQGKVVGAMYSPNSEFECFTGSQKNSTLDVKSVGVDAQSVTAKINLSNLHPIKTISADEQRLISTCKQETAAQTNK